MENNLRYQVYGLKTNGSLDKPITYPFYSIERANRYFTECLQCALVSIDRNGTVVEIIAENKTPIQNNDKDKPKYQNRKGKFR